MNERDAAFLQACIADLMGQPVPQDLPKMHASPMDYLPVFSGIDNSGNAYQTAGTTAFYSWPNDMIAYTRYANNADMAQEFAHRMQNLSGVERGKPHSEEWRAMEAEANRIAKQAQAECLDFWGNVKPVEMDQRKDLINALSQSREAKPPITE